MLSFVLINSVIFNLLRVWIEYHLRCKCFTFILTVLVTRVTGGPNVSGDNGHLAFSSAGLMAGRADV